jgi:DNA-binding transcriptional LysR family regulator
MDVRQLRCFDAVLTTGAMTLAAELLGLAQPTVSITIQQLEKEIGFSLFHRSKGRLVPTPEAYWFHQATKEALDGVARNKASQSGASFYSVLSCNFVAIDACVNFRLSSRISRCSD